MRDRLGVSDNVSIRLIRGTPETFYIVRPITPELKIPKDFPIPCIRFDDHVEFHVMAHSEDEAESILQSAIDD